MSKFVAVVYVEDSQRPDGSLACFVADDQDDATNKALAASGVWQATSSRKYRILVGKLTHEANRPVDYWRLDEGEASETS